uniref:Glutathione transferase n=1 Tax=Arion vulgaris TaxID=1028688 RepID=A0A0B6ZHZ8_9EUPU
MADSKVKLTYFNFNGRAEIIRLVLTFAGKAFEDNRVSQEEWQKIKPTSPFGQLPFVEIDGEVFGQSLAIAQYFARVHNLYGKTNLDGLRIDQISQLIEDYIQQVVKVFHESDEAKKAEIVTKVKTEEAPKYIGYLEKILEKNGGEHLVGNSYTLVDLAAYDLGTGFLKTYTEDALEKAPLLRALIEKVGSNEKIRTYTESHK